MITISYPKRQASSFNGMRVRTLVYKRAKSVRNGRINSMFRFSWSGIITIALKWAGIRIYRQSFWGRRAWSQYVFHTPIDLLLIELTLHSKVPSIIIALIRVVTICRANVTELRHRRREALARVENPVALSLIEQILDLERLNIWPYILSLREHLRTHKAVPYLSHSFLNFIDFILDFLLYKLLILYKRTFNSYKIRIPLNNEYQSWETS